MKTKIFLLVILVTFVTNVAFSQSLGSQLKIIFGDALTEYGKNDFSRFLGKALSTSGNMNYNMELINAQNKQEITINLPPNTSLGQNNQVIPNPGYQWTNPNNSSDFGVVQIDNYPVQPIGVTPINNYSVQPLYGSSTLPPYDLNYLQSKYAQLQDNATNLTTLLNIGSTLNVLFTYNWVSDINGDGKFVLDEFNNIKRSFKVGEQIGFAFEFVARCGTNSFGKDIGDNLSLLIQIFDNTNGELIAKGNYSFHEGSGPVRFSNRVLWEYLGNYFPLGQYLISVSIISSDRLTPYSVTSLKEPFEVIK